MFYWVCPTVLFIISFVTKQKPSFQRSRKGAISASEFVGTPFSCSFVLNFSLGNWQYEYTHFSVDFFNIYAQGFALFLWSQKRDFSEDHVVIQTKYM